MNNRNEVETLIASKMPLWAVAVWILAVGLSGWASYVLFSLALNNKLVAGVIFILLLLLMFGILPWKADKRK